MPFVVISQFLKIGDQKKMSEENGTGNNLIWAVTLIIVVAIIGGAFYFGVIKSNNSPTKNNIDVEIKTPVR